MSKKEHVPTIVVESSEIYGSVSLYGAKNAVLVSIASLILTTGKSVLKNVPFSTDVYHMIELIKELGARVVWDSDAHELYVDTTDLNKYRVSDHIMKQMRASILVMGPLLAQFGKADVALPGGCVLGARPINYHLNAFRAMGVSVDQEGAFLRSHAPSLQGSRIIFEYPSVGATENVLMAAVLANGETSIVNAALEPEVLDLVALLRKMGARIAVEPGVITVEGVKALNPIEHEVVPDRLEAGALLIAAAITGGSITLSNARAHHMDAFLEKLRSMGHRVIVSEKGLMLKATKSPQAVSFKTGPYPGFPTDLQAPLMAAQCVAQGQSVIEETVFENRLVHVHELRKMGAQINLDGNRASIIGVDELFGADVIASDIRASCALVLAGLVSQGKTIISGVQHWRRGYDALEKKLHQCGANICVKGEPNVVQTLGLIESTRQL